MDQQPKSSRYIALLREGTDLDVALRSVRQLGLTEAVAIPLIRGLRCDCDADGRRQLLGHPDIEVVEQDLVVTITSQSVWRRHRQRNGEVVPEGIQAIRAHLVWPSSEGNGIGVAIIDTGVDHWHPDLAGNIGGGLNLIAPESLPQDDVGHGTHVAGIVAAMRNAEGVVGVAPRARLYPIKVVGAKTDGWLSDIIFGLQWVVERQIPIVNISLGTPSRSRAYECAVGNTIGAGVTVVAAVGNGGAEAIEYPAAFPGVIGVGAIGPTGEMAPFSAKGQEVSLVAPGVRVLSTQCGGQYGRSSGTSMASPHVAGVAALYLQLHPHATPEQVRAALCASAVPVQGASGHQQGAGLLNAWQAIHHPPRQ